MATVNATNMGTLLTGDGTKVAPGIVGGNVRAFIETVEYDGQASGDVIRIARVPAGARVIGFVLQASATAGASAQLAIGDADSETRFRAAATYTATTLTFLNVAAGMGHLYETETDILLKVTVAALPTSADYLKIITLYTVPS